MMRRILSFALISVLLLGAPTVIQASAAIEIIDNDFQTPTISVSHSTVFVTNAMGETLRVYNVAGVCVMNAKIDSPDKRFELSLPKGCYILKVGKVVRKVSIK